MADNPEPNDDPVPPWLQAGYNPKEDDIWTSPSGVVHHASAKEASGLYAPSESNDFLANYNSTMTQDALSAVMERLRATPASEEERQGAYQTIGVNIDGQEMEIPVREGELKIEAEDAARTRLEWGLSPFASDAELEAAQQDKLKELQGRDDVSAPGYAFGGAVDNPLNNEVRLNMLGNAPQQAPIAPAPQDPYTTSVMSYADKVKALLEQRAAPVDTMANPAGPPAGPPVTGALPGTPPENPAQDNMTINARSGEYVFPEPAVKYYGVKKLEDMVHKAIEDINPPGQPAPEPPTQAQTFAKGGLINRKHFLRLPKGHAYDKMSPKKHPLKSAPTGAPPVAMDPAAMQTDPSMQMGPPTQPTQPPLPSYAYGGRVGFGDNGFDGLNPSWPNRIGPAHSINNPPWINRIGPAHAIPPNWIPRAIDPAPVKPLDYGDMHDRGYWGGGMVWNNPDYWHGRNWDMADVFRGPQVFTFPSSRDTWNPNNFQPDIPSISQEYNANPPQSRHTPHRLHKAMGGIVEPDSPYPHFYYGGRVGGIEGIDNPFAANIDMLGTVLGRWYGGIARSNPYIGNYQPGGLPGYMPPPGTSGFGQGPTYNSSYFDPQGYPYAQPNSNEYASLQGSRHTPPRKTQ